MSLPRGVIAAVVIAIVALPRPIAQTKLAPLDRPAQSWVDQTLKKMTLDEKIGQLLVTSFNASFTSVDSDAFAKLRHQVREVKVGGIHLWTSIQSSTSTTTRATRSSISDRSAR